MKPKFKLAGKVARIVLLSAWASAIVLAVSFYISDPQRFTAVNIAHIVRSFHTEIWVVYLAMSALRGFTLLPSTPLVLAGTVLYPDHPWLVLAISMAGILLSSGLIYFFSDALGFSEYFEKKRPRAVAAIRRRLDDPAGITFVAVWAFFPLVPTDAVCYVAGTIKMNFLKFIAAVFAGEFVLCSIYIFGGGSMVRDLL